MAAFAVGAASAVTGLGGTVLTASGAGAFGTIASQRLVHERITRLALACPPGVASDGGCFEPRSLDQLAGRARTFGAVGAPDSDEVLGHPEAHCDDADFLDIPGYPNTRAQATAKLNECITHLRRRVDEGVTAADGLLRADGTLDGDAVDLRKSCTFTAGLPGRAKCTAIEGFGRALHGAQDFYAHSNWADEADPAVGPGLTNPPGLNLPAPSPLLDLRGTTFAPVPHELSTGHFVPQELILSCPNAARFEKRVTHRCLNKDKLTLDVATGVVTDPDTPRGRVGTNAAKAVAAAVTETRRQWTDFRAELVAVHGAERGHRMISALTQDVPRVDTVLAIDTTESMDDDIAAVQAAASRIVDDLSGDEDLADYRVAVVEYKDLYSDCPEDGFAARVDLGFTGPADRKAILTAIDALGAAGGCDTPESVYSGIMAGLELPWRDGAKKSVIAMGDAPPHDPEPVTGHTLATIIDKARSIDPAVIHTLDTTGRAGAGFSALAVGTGGTHAEVRDAAAVVDVLRRAIASMSAVPVADAGGPYSAGVGERITFAADASTDDKGAIVRYEWDLQSDGHYDVSAPAPTIEHAYPAPFTGQVTVRVTDADGHRAEAMAPVDIGGNQAPVAVTGGPYTGGVGSPVTFDLSGSSDPDGAIDRFELDADGDGTVDITGGGTTLTTVYTEPFDGQAVVRVIDDDGRAAVATVAVEITEDDLEATLPPELRSRRVIPRRILALAGATAATAALLLFLSSWHVVRARP